MFLDGEKVMATKKAGCVLVNTKTKMIGLIFRDFRNDYSFPKGHLETGETLQECAIRETAEETKRDCKIIEEAGEFVEHYTTPNGEECETHMFLAVDTGKSDNTSTDVHDLIWTSFEKVEDVLTYQTLKDTWNFFREKIAKMLEKQL